MEDISNNYKNKNILLIIPNGGFGGAQRAICDLSLKLSQIYNLYLIVFSENDPISYNHSGVLYNLNVSSSNNLFGKFCNFFLRIINLNRFIKEKNIDTTISYLEGANYINALSCSPKKIISIRSSIESDREIFGLLGFVRKKIMMPFVYRFADSVVALSEGISHELINVYKLNPEKIKVICNYFDMVEIDRLSKEPLSKKYALIFKKPVVVMSGRLHFQKGHEEFLEVFRRVKSHIDCNLLLVGDGALKKHLIEVCLRKGLKPSESLDCSADVYFVGFQKNPFNFISNSQAFVFPSFYEGLGNSLAEAMSIGIPILASDCPYGPRELMNPDKPWPVGLSSCEPTNNGYLMPLLTDEKSIDEWTCCLLKILSDSKLAQDISDNAKNRMRSFVPEAITKKWVELIGSK